MEQPVKKSKKEPYKIIYQNIRSLRTENSKMKLDYFKEYLTKNNILMIYIETWLNDSVQEDAKIN